MGLDGLRNQAVSLKTTVIDSMSLMAMFQQSEPLGLLRVPRGNDMVSRMDSGADSDLIASITPDVMTCLRRLHFFEGLDDVLCPKEDPGQREVCAGDHKLSKRILEVAGFDLADLEDIFKVLRAQGACCDCEVLYNVAESSRLKAEYWKSRAEGTEANPKHPGAAQSWPQSRESWRPW